LRARLAHAHDPPATDFDSGAAHARKRVEPVAIGARGDDLPVELGGRVEVVVVVVETRRLELLRLAFAQEAERRAGLKAQRLDRFASPAVRATAVNRGAGLSVIGNRVAYLHGTIIGLSRKVVK